MSAAAFDAVLAQMSSIVLADRPLGATLGIVAQIAVDHVPGVAQASITLIENDRPRSVAFTGDLAATLDERQYGSGTGPCLDAAAAGTTISIDDTAHDDVYPDFARQAARAGVSHTLSIGLPDMLSSRSTALNLYCTGPRMEPDIQNLAEGIARYAAVAVINAAVHASALVEIEQLRTAMASRAAIEQAKGIIIGSRRCTPDAAFAILRAESNATNRKLREVAQDLVNSMSG